MPKLCFLLIANKSKLCAAFGNGLVSWQCHLLDMLSSKRGVSGWMGISIGAVYKILFGRVVDPIFLVGDFAVLIKLLPNYKAPWPHYLTLITKLVENTARCDLITADYLRGNFQSWLIINHIKITPDQANKACKTTDYASLWPFIQTL